MIDNTIDNERFIQYAAEGRLTKHALATRLAPEPRRLFLDACAAIEKKFTDDCAATGDHCLQSGCALQGEVCLEPLLRAGTEYHKACGAEWVRLFGERHTRA
jgi:hypothetical protein